MEERVGAVSLQHMFEDQRAFNRLIWDARQFPGERHLIDGLRHLAIGMVEETLEFLRTYEYKTHRRSKGKLQNIAHSHEELVDQFKYWLSLVDVSEFPIERLEELYYAKSRVVQYRYQEEWLKTVDRPSVVVDIDGVLADYVSGVCSWIREWGSALLKLRPKDAVGLMLRIQEIQKSEGRRWVNADSLGISYEQWKILKHDFRTKGGKRLLPVFEDARQFLHWCRDRGWVIILVTSRPVDRYPNIFTDTISWLDKSELPFDHLWWATEKTERIEEANIVMRSQIVFAVDDDPKFVAQFRSKCVKTYWLVRQGLQDCQAAQDVTTVTSLTELMEKETAQ